MAIAFIANVAVGKLRAASLQLFADAINSLITVSPTYTARSTVVGAAVASVTISGIPSTLKRLRITWAARGDNAVQDELITMQVGGDTGANYSYTNYQVQNTTLTGGSAHGSTSGVVGLCTGSTATATVFATGTILLTPWDNINAGSLGYTFDNQCIGTAVANHFITGGGGMYSGASARTSVTFLPQANNFIAGTDFQLEGW